eukprot:361663-Chlamydomonas_euryale.AAC.2
MHGSTCPRRQDVSTRQLTMQTCPHGMQTVLLVAARQTTHSKSASLWLDAGAPLEVAGCFTWARGCAGPVCAGPGICMFAASRAAAAAAAELACKMQHGKECLTVYKYIGMARAVDL